MKSRASTEAAPAMYEKIVAQIAVLQDQLEDSIGDDTMSLEIALMLLELYEKVLEHEGIFIFDHGETMH